MALLQPQDLFLVYTPETGVPTSLLATGVDGALIDKTSGETYNVDITNNNEVEDQFNDGTETYVSTGYGLKVDIKIRDGKVVDMFIVNGGSDYIENEIGTIAGGDAQVIIRAVDDNGVAKSLEFYLNDGGEGYSVTDGLVTDFPYGHHDDLMNMQTYQEGGSNIGNFVDFTLVNGQVQLYSTTGELKKFPSDTAQDTTKEFTVGDVIHVLADKTKSGQHLDATIATVREVSSGGAVKFTTDQLKTEVQEWAGELDTTIDLSVSVEGFNGTDVEGTLTYDDTTGQFTYYQPDLSKTEVDVTLNNDYGFVLDETGNFTSDSITTQDQLNANLLKRIQYLEQNLYAPTADQKINYENPRLADNTMARNDDEEYVSYGVVATRNDVEPFRDQIEQLSDRLFQLDTLLEQIRDNDTYAGLHAIYYTDEQPDPYTP